VLHLRSPDATPDAKAHLIEALQAKVSEQHDWGTKAWSNIQRLNDRIVELEAECDGLRSRLAGSTAQMEATKRVAATAEAEVSSLEQRLSAASNLAQHQFHQGFEEGVRAKGVSDPQLTGKVRGLEEDNSLLRQRLVNALYRIDALALPAASAGTAKQVQEGGMMSVNAAASSPPASLNAYRFSLPLPATVDGRKSQTLATAQATPAITPQSTHSRPMTQTADSFNRSQTHTDTYRGPRMMTPPITPRDSMTSAERATHDGAVAASLASVAASSYPPVPLPLGWTEHVSKTTGRTYFRHKDSAQSRWSRPTQ